MTQDVIWDDFLKPAEVAKILRVTPKTVIKLVQDPTSGLDGIKVGVSYRFSISNIKKFLKKETDK